MERPGVEARHASTSTIPPYMVQYRCSTHTLHHTTTTTIHHQWIYVFKLSHHCQNLDDTKLSLYIDITFPILKIDNTPVVNFDNKCSRWIWNQFTRYKIKKKTLLLSAFFVVSLCLCNLCFTCHFEMIQSWRSSNWGCSIRPQQVKSSNWGRHLQPVWGWRSVRLES